MSTDPALKDYVSKDSKGEGGIYNPVNLSLYHYAGNNPLKYTDPDGRSSWVRNESFGLIPKQDNNIDTSLAKKICGLALIGLGNFLDKGGGAAIAAAVTAGTSGAGAIAAPAIIAGSEALGAYLEIAGAAIFLESYVEDIANSNVNFSSSGDNHNKEKKPTSQNQMQKQVERGKAPKNVDRVDKAHNSTGKPHVHFKDGTVHDAHNGTPNLTNEVKEWLIDNGWSTGE